MIALLLMGWLAQSPVLAGSLEDSIGREHRPVQMDRSGNKRTSSKRSSSSAPSSAAWSYAKSGKAAVP